MRINNFGIYDHPHIVVSAATRTEIRADFDTLGLLGLEAVQRTLELMRFSPAESEELNFRLDQIV